MVIRLFRGRAAVTECRICGNFVYTACRVCMMCVADKKAVAKVVNIKGAGNLLKVKEIGNPENNWFVLV